MRALIDALRLHRLMRALGQAADRTAEVFFTGGATAVLVGWRASTLDADIRVVPDADWLYRAVPRLKEDLEINIEFAAPSDFIPELPGWRERCVPIGREGPVSFLHYDFASQALAKIERGHALDRTDVEEMIRRRLVDPARLRELFASIEPNLSRYPAIDPPSFRNAVWAATDVSA